MIFRRYRFQLIARSLLMVASALLLAYLIGWTEQFYAPVAVGLAIIYEIFSLIHYAEKAVRDIGMFLESVRQADFSQVPTTGGRGPLYNRLGNAFSAVMEEFRRVRADKEGHLQYVQTVVHHIGIALISFREDGTVELINTAAKRLLGTGQLRNVKQLYEWSRPFVETLLHLPSGEHAVVKVTEEDREMQLAIFVTRFRLHGEFHALTTIQDIRNELEEKEMEAWQKLTRVLTHEIMNSTAPIASLASTASKLLQRGATNEEALLTAEVVDDTREALAAIERRSGALMHFADSYRSFTKIIKPNFKVFPVSSLFAQVHRLLRLQAEELGLAFEVSVVPQELELTADEELIEQILINLLLNAMDALEGQASARIALRARVNRYAHPIIQVVDNGPGIPADLQERIFVPFFTTKEEGSGIGLSLSRQIMRLHGGSLSVRSTPGVETIFTLRF